MQSYGKNLIKANKITKTKAKKHVFGNFGVTGGKTNAATNGCKYATKGENVK